MELTTLDNVIYNDELHLYTLVNESTFETKPLCGVTRMIKEIVCPDLYKDVDEATLAKAAEKGKRLHSLCERFDNGEFACRDGVLYDGDTAVTDPELLAYQRLIKENEIFPIASEYLVSDQQNFASPIDKVAQLDKKSVAIIDLKFTYAYMEEPVMWQTSLYADEFERMNPGIKVKKLYCIHIHQYKDSLTADLHELRRVPSEALDNLKEYFLMRERGMELPPFENPMSKTAVELEWSEDDEAELLRVRQELKNLKDVESAMMERIKTRMTENNANAVQGKTFRVTQSIARHKLVFDEDRFRDENRDLYLRYMTRDKVTAGRTTLTIIK